MEAIKTSKLQVDASAQLMLNIGAGLTSLPGYTNVDRKMGQEAWPLDYPDNSADIIRASHVLEHFNYEDIPAVLADWYRVLKSGGCMKVAVPDFGKVCEAYVKNKPIPYQGYIMGGHMDEDDHHRAVMDKHALRQQMANAGLERLGRWDSELKDAAALPITLNLMGYKPVMDCDQAAAMQGVAATLACPRFGPTMHFASIAKANIPLGIPVRMIQGCFWWQQLCEGLELQLAQGYNFIITMDYDTVFHKHDVVELCRLMRVYPEADAICAVQAKRGGASGYNALFSLGPEVPQTTRVFSGDIVPARTGHFGLTIFRASSLNAQARPWMTPQPDKDGRWDKGKGQIDVDIDFWNRWHAAGKTLFLANRVAVGHLEEVIAWPDENFAVHYQPYQDYVDHGKPPECRKGIEHDAIGTDDSNREALGRAGKDARPEDNRAADNGKGGADDGDVSEEEASNRKEKEIKHRRCTLGMVDPSNGQPYTTMYTDCELGSEEDAEGKEEKVRPPAPANHSYIG